MHSIAQLPFLPLSLHALSEAPFFVSNEPGVVRAGFLMLEAAWRSSRPGSIAASFSELSVITRLALHEVEAHYAVLTAGWDLLGDGRLHNAQLEAICDGITNRFSEQLEVLAEASAAAIQGGSAQFELVPTAEVFKKKRGKHLIPKDFAFNRATQMLATTEGFSTPELQNWLLRTLNDYANSRSVMYTDWQAACRQFMCSEITRNAFKSRFHHFPGEQASSVVVKHKSASDRLRAANAASSMPSFQVRTMQNNSNKMHGSVDSSQASENASNKTSPTFSDSSKIYPSHAPDMSDIDFEMLNAHNADVQSEGMRA